MDTGLTVVLGIFASAVVAYALLLLPGKVSGVVMTTGRFGTVKQT